MPDKLEFNLMDRDRCRSRFDWINIERGTDRIGKIRALIEGDTLTIFSINIFPEFERKGYARKIIDTFKAMCNRIIADRVRYTAVGFWVKMGFVNAGAGTYVYDEWRSRVKN
jgi:GNAT superfamily N-acetyltransferase